MNPDFPKIAETIHVVGGGCFGTQYTRWLLLARRKGMIRFGKIRAIDRDRDCRLRREGLESAEVELVTSDWVEYLSGYLLKHPMEREHQDLWVPSPVTPHLIFLSFLKATERLHASRWQVEKFGGEPKVPFRIELANGSLALSFAEWICPVNCIEPARCPAIRGPRDWDMKKTLEGYFSRESSASVHLLQCTHWAHGVGVIPMRDILGEFRRMLGALETGEVRDFIVATTSRCHGVLSRARLDGEEWNRERIFDG